MNKIDTRKESIVFTGYYGMSNFGDDIFGAVCAWGASSFWQHDFRILSPRIQSVKADFSVPDWFRRDVYASTGLVGKVSRLGFAVREVSRSQHMIFAGGSVFTAANTGVMKVIEKVARANKLNLSGMGVSIGPFASAEDECKVKEFLSHFQFLSVRDNASYLLAKDFGLNCPVVMAGDLAGGMQIANEKFNRDDDSTTKKLKIGLALCNYESIIGQDTEVELLRNRALLQGVVKTARQYDAHVQIFSLNNHPRFGDNGLAQMLSDHLAKENIEHHVTRNNDSDVGDIWRQIASCDAFLSVRLHGAIAAYLNNVPFALIEYHKKCGDFLDDIGQHDSLRIPGSVMDEVVVCRILEKLLLTPLLPEMRPTDYSQRSLEHFTAAPWAIVSEY